MSFSVLGQTSRASRTAIRLDRRSAKALLRRPASWIIGRALSIRENDMLTVWFQFPTACCLVFYRTVILLETGIALFPWFVFTAILIEACNGKPRPISRGLTGLGTQIGDKCILLGKGNAILLEITISHASRVHPEPEAFVQDRIGQS